MAIPDHRFVVEQCKSANAEAWANAHTGNSHTEDFIRLLAPMLKAVDARYGINGKRGNPNDVSDDAVNYLCDAADSDGRTPEGLPCVVIDVIGAAGAIPPYTPSNPAPFVAWGVYRTKIEGSGANVDPNGQPAPPPAQYPPYEALGGDEGGKKVTRLMEADYLRAEKQGLDGDSGAWQWRTAYDFLTRKFTTVEESIEAHQPEWRHALNQERASQGKPPIAW